MMEPELAQTAMRIMTYLRDDRCGKPYRAISKGTNLPSSTLQRQIKNLLKGNYIQRIDKAMVTGNGQVVNIFVLTDKGKEKVKKI